MQNLASWTTYVFDRSTGQKHAQNSKKLARFLQKILQNTIIYI